MNIQTKLIYQLIEVSNNLYKQNRSNTFGDAFITIQFYPLCQGTNVTRICYDVLVVDSFDNFVKIGRFDSLNIVIDKFRSFFSPSFVRSLQNIQRNFENLSHD